MQGNLFAHLNRVVMEGSRGVGKRVKRQDDGSRTDFKNLGGLVPVMCAMSCVCVVLFL